MESGKSRSGSTQRGRGRGYRPRVRPQGPPPAYPQYPQSFNYPQPPPPMNSSEYNIAMTSDFNPFGDYREGPSRREPSVERELPLYGEDDDDDVEFVPETQQQTQIGIYIFFLYTFFLYTLFFYLLFFIRYFLYVIFFVCYFFTLVFICYFFIRYFFFNMKMFKWVKGKLKRIKRLGRRSKRLLWLKHGFISRHVKKSGMNKEEISFGKEFWSISRSPLKILSELIIP